MFARDSKKNFFFEKNNWLAHSLNVVRFRGRIVWDGVHYNNTWGMHPSYNGRYRSPVYRNRNVTYICVCVCVCKKNFSFFIIGILSSKITSKKKKKKSTTVTHDGARARVICPTTVRLQLQLQPAENAPCALQCSWIVRHSPAAVMTIIGNIVAISRTITRRTRARYKKNLIFFSSILFQ